VQVDYKLYTAAISVS